VTASAAALVDGFIPVAVETLRSATDLEFDLYLPPDEDKPAKLYRGKHIECAASDFDRLLERGTQTLYITSGAAKAYREFLKQNVLNDSRVPVGQRLQTLKDAARVTFNEALRGGDANRLSTLAHEFGGELAQLFQDNDFVLSDLVSVMLHDYSTFTHMTHVATYSILLAQQLGINAAADLSEIAKGGLLHDVGKRFISVSILEKPERLDEREMGIIRDHPRCGFAELCQRNDISWGALMMIYQHHERCQGGGYPVGSVAEEIHPWGRICAIADVFDAMASNRAYHKGNTVGEVNGYLQQQAGKGFDLEMVQCWSKMIEGAVLPR
jgi:HD-GYP domain-containing protein (c-di-GMP phosphodiesterase class II)